MNLTNILDNPKYNTTMALLITIISLLILFNFINVLNKSQEQTQQITGQVIRANTNISPGNIIFSVVIFITIFTVIFVGTKLYISLKEY